MPPPQKSPSCAQKLPRSSPVTTRKIAAPRIRKQRKEIRVKFDHLRSDSPKTKKLWGNIGRDFFGIIFHFVRDTVDPEIGSLGRCLFIVDDVTTKEDAEIGVQRTKKYFF